MRGTSSRRGQPRPYAELMNIWEEGYVANSISFENMHTPVLLVVEGGALRSADGTLDRGALRAYIESAVAGEKYFRLRLRRSALGLTPPAWVPDERFDLDRHLQFSDVVEQLDDASLRRLAGAEQPPMSMRHPLWRMRISPLADGNIAIGIVTHHASNDGVSGFRTLSSITRRTPEEAAEAPRDPFLGGRAAHAWELPVLAWRAWREQHPSLADAWRAARRTSWVRRARRTLARCLLPVRYHRSERERAAALPSRDSAFRSADIRQVGRRASQLGGTVGDLQAAALIASWEGENRHVALRVPVSLHTIEGARMRNHVRDIVVRGDADADIGTTVAALRAQVGDETRHESPSPPSRTLGYSTVLPWVSRARYFAGAKVLAVVSLPASLGNDGLAASGIVYDGVLTFAITMPTTGDASSVASRMRELMTGETDSVAS